MTKTADVKEVAAHFTDWIEEVAAGHEVVVTRNNQPVARVVAPAPARGTLGLGEWLRAHAHASSPISHRPVSQSELASEIFDRR